VTAQTSSIAAAARSSSSTISASVGTGRVGRRLIAPMMPHMKLSLPTTFELTFMSGRNAARRRRDEPSTAPAAGHASTIL
jgi:hypothetical protein